ncbi:hypothetical protein V8C86DRAFT_2502585 [Haematococcus lacustris]
MSRVSPLALGSCLGLPQPSSLDHLPTTSQPSPAQPSPAQPGPAQPSPAQPSPAQPSPAQPSPAQPSPAQPSPAQPSPAQPSPAQPSPAQPSLTKGLALQVLGYHTQLPPHSGSLPRSVWVGHLALLIYEQLSAHA